MTRTEPCRILYPQANMPVCRRVGDYLYIYAYVAWVHVTETLCVGGSAPARLPPNVCSGQCVHHEMKLQE